MSLLGDHRSLVDFMDRLLQELDSVRPNRAHSNPPPPQQQPTSLTSPTTPTQSTSSNEIAHQAGSSKPSKPPPPPPPKTTMPASAVHQPSATDAGIKVRPKPAVPPKPPLDSIRFSMATVEGESLPPRVTDGLLTIVHF